MAKRPRRKARRGSARYQFTYRRKAALHRAALKSAAKRKGKKLSGKHIAAIGSSVGVLAVGASAAVVLGRKHSGPQAGGPKSVTQHMPPRAKPTAPLGPKGIRPKEIKAGDVVEFKRIHRVNVYDKYETYDYGEVLHQDDRSVAVRLFGSAERMNEGGKILQGISRRNITGHRIKRTGISPNPPHISDAMWQRAELVSWRFLKDNP